MNRKIQSAEHLKTGTQFSLLWSATSRRPPSALLRPHADILQLRCVPTHCSFNLTASSCSRDAPKNTVAPRPVTSGTHLNLVCSASPRRSSVTALRPHADLPSLHCVLDAPNSIIAPRLLPQRRTWTLFVLRPSALSLYWTCVSSDKNDFKTLRDNPVNQIYRSDHALKRSGDSPSLDLDITPIKFHI